MTLCAVMLGVLVWTPYNRRARLNAVARAQIDPYELKMAGGGDIAKAPPELVAILGDSRLKHWGRVSTGEFLSQTQLATFGRDNFLRVWDVESGKQTWQVETRGAAICGPAGCAYFINSEGKLVRWDAVTGKTVDIELPPETQLGYIQVNPEGSHLITWRRVGDQGEVDVWEIATAKKLRTVEVPKGVSHVALNRTGDMLAVSFMESALVAKIPGSEAPLHLGPLKYGDGLAAAYQVAFTPDSKRVLVAGGGSEVYQFDSETGRELPRIQELRSNISRIWFRDQSPMLLISGGGNLFSFTPSGDSWELGDTSPTPGSGYFEGYRRAANFLDVNGVQLTRMNRPARVAGGLPECLTAIDFSPDGYWLATGNQSGEIALWRTGTWTKGISWRGHTDAIRSLRFSHSGEILAALGEDGFAVFWDPKTGEEIRSLKNWLSRKELAFSWDDEWLATAQVGKSDWQICDVVTGETLFSLPERPRGEMAFSPDGKLIAAAGGKTTLNVWDIEKRSIVARLGKTTSYDLDVLFHPDGRRVLTGGTGFSVRVWDIPSQKEVLALSDPAAKSRPLRIALSKSGTLVAAASEDGVARLWELETNKLLAVFQVGPATGVVADVCFSPDGSYLATLNGNGTVYVLSLDGIRKQ
ncbi:MAG: WD40 repeat domain-containing protein [Planctomycetales bacterium]|nr:WD40 repeat domain-containing protein [Planctomycetales bacterium]